MLERGAIEALAGEEHHDEVRSRRELLPVRLRSQFRDVVANVTDEVRLLRLAGFLAQRLVESVEQSLQRSLRVHNHVAASGQLDDQIRAQQSSVAVARRRLLDEIAVLEHARSFDRPPKLHLTPAPTCGGRPQSRCEAAGLGTELLLQRDERAYLR